MYWLRGVRYQKENFPTARPEAHSNKYQRRYSRGLRQRAAKLFQATPGFTLVAGRTATYHADLCDAVFCLSFLGAGWSPRTVDAVAHGCIPIVVQPHTLQVRSALLAPRSRPKVDTNAPHRL
jgi:hypothetical protein